ncbi:alpha/beta fold hydrolase [Polynucleobacter sp. es-MAR-4]|uniref:alpha/beta fold hydrolase n=1 Tax=Polynucleobacter sp. es-MAR-4 TaxID=1855655 RepID=UPI001C0CE053|nr:alpha/beta hydrolase [Polynucleobacter sp. es-MAR-4]MBU3636191.1 alpha/beta fold hydrolase [Polynucleobacter sp. es-MAR-4]
MNLIFNIFRRLSFNRIDQKIVAALEKSGNVNSSKISLDVMGPISDVDSQEGVPQSNIGSNVTPPENRYLNITDGAVNRKLAYTISGNLQATKVLLCLPGLLETRGSFLNLHTYFLNFSDCKVISVDLPGRGDSESIAESDNYKMSLYLSDIKYLMKVILDNSPATSTFTVLGTSMGGVLAMYLTQTFGKKISEIILNDIALTVNWTALYSLYKSMKNEIGFKEIKDLAQDLRVDAKAITDVQLPGHFDLSYKADVWGMNFHEAMDDYRGRVALIYGSDSKICTRQRVSSAKVSLPALITFEVKGAGHPVPFTHEVCEFIQLQMKLKQVVASNFL